jgi:hypothetical protein
VTIDCRRRDQSFVTSLFLCLRQTLSRESGSS